MKLTGAGHGQAEGTRVDAAAAEDASSFAIARGNQAAAGAGTDNETKGIEMTTAAHTPGPWRTKSGPGWIETYIVGELVGAHEPSIATVKSVYVDHGSYIANARLIAAAPELLAALQSALAVIEDYLEYTHDGDPWKEDARTMGEMDINDYHGDGRLESARAAIAKAIGAAS